ncbi:hypothetical protein A3Q56_02410 [Intoshia linei]|uniref:Uncharacterized protein n=1 Tax=Intoshia linei TaxID=1819745 RepID=A0A177B6H8_9BILA|nr:hypothetical protein A3Q56_02410 [Intoshia linei]
MNPQLSKILTSSNVTLNDKGNYLNSIILTNTVVIDSRKNFTKIKPFKKMYPKSARHVPRGPKIYTPIKNYIMALLSIFLKSPYMYHYTGLFFLVIFIISKIFVFYNIHFNNLTELYILILNLNYSVNNPINLEYTNQNENFIFNMHLFSFIFDIVHLIIVLLIAMIFILKTKWIVTINGKNQLQIFSSIENDELKLKTLDILTSNSFSMSKTKYTNLIMFQDKEIILEIIQNMLIENDLNLTQIFSIDMDEKTLNVITNILILSIEKYYRCIYDNQSKHDQDKDKDILMIK